MPERNRIKAFYPASTSHIMHRGREGNLYQLDGFKSWVALNEVIKSDPYFLESVVLFDKNPQIAKQLFLSAHSPRVLEAYRTGEPESLANSAGVMWQPELYQFVLEEALSCRLAVDEATKHGFSLAVTGGGHHAEYNRPLGFCVLNTMAIAALYAQRKHGLRTALIDTDVHYSNGCFDILKGKNNIWCSSIWNKKLDYWNYFESSGNIWHEFIESAEEYMASLTRLINNMQEFSPNFVVYHLGLDVLDSDRMGGIRGFGETLLYKRERVVANALMQMNIPYIMFFGSSYIDHSRGEKFAQQNRRRLSLIQKEAIDIHLKTLRG